MQYNGLEAVLPSTIASVLNDALLNPGAYEILRKMQVDAYVFCDQLARRLNLSGRDVETLKDRITQFFLAIQRAIS